MIPFFPFSYVNVFSENILSLLLFICIDGVSNCKALEKLGGKFPALEKCRSLGKDWYLPSEGELKRAFEDQGVKFRLNSFCLHLIIATKKGVVLSRIGRGKENDYPLSWAATIGEQIEFVDFCSVKGNGKEYNKKF